MRTSLLSFFLLCALQGFSQKAYFQQEVNYTIDVTLNDRSHILKGFERMEYINRSPDTLKFLLVHLWPNAYKNDRTAFTAHQVENGEKEFYYSNENDRGFIDSLEFKADGDPVNISEYNNHQDIVMLELNRPLLPGGSMVLTTPFRVVLPEVFSRLGHAGQHYQISQWYPKPAVYDRKGWHPMPYLDQGEFYSEFGSFEVKITLPKAYLVAATGDLQEETEREWISRRTAARDTFTYKQVPEAEAVEWKTLTFIQQNVHDFAWFASKEFRVEKTDVTLGNSKIVSCYSYYKPGNARFYEGSSAITAKTIRYLSDSVGEYPYKHATVVDGKLLAGGGMEYPNVTVIGSVGSKEMLQTVIIHEVGHNWFYGILGSNERNHPWMDEGINSFYEGRIDEQLKREDTAQVKSDGFFDRLGNQFNGSFIYLLNAKQGLDQPIEGPAPDFTSFNYGGIVYKKSQLMLDYLSDYLGAPVFNRAMKRYFAEWKFRHPYPEDFRAIVEQESGRDLSWFFQEGIQTTERIDFRLADVRRAADGSTAVRVNSRTNFRGPIPVDEIQDGKVIARQWSTWPHENPILFPASSQARQFRVDAPGRIPDVNLLNNGRSGGLLGLRLRALGGLGQRTHRDLFILPSLGYNHYDRLMVGGILHNLSIPNSAFQFALSPMYSIGTGSWAGSGIMGYSFYPRQTFRKITLGLQARSFHHRESNLNIRQSLYLRHSRFSPSLSMEFRNPVSRSPVSDVLTLQYDGVLQEEFAFNRDPVDSLYRPVVQDAPYTQLLRIGFSHRHARTFHPYSYRLAADVNEYFLKLGLTAQLRVDYHMKRRTSFYARVYAGKFFDFGTSTNPFALSDQYLASSYTGVNDVMYNDVYVARNEQSGALSQQIAMREGGFKVRTNRYANPIGRSDNWLAAVNLRSDLPVKLPVKLQVFMDAGTFANAGKLNPSGNKLLFDAGLELHLLGDMLIVYAPLLMSKDFRDYNQSIYTKNRLLNTLSFSLNLSSVNVLHTNGVLKLLGIN